MKSKETIKVFISSKCGGEHINFDGLVKTESSNKQALADKAIKTNYDIVRRALKIALENTGFIETYIFEDDPASTSSSRDDFLFKLDQSDICLFLIDNFDKEIPKGVLAEVERAKQTNKKSIYLFLQDSNHPTTDLQKNLTGAEGRHYYPISDVREFIDSGYAAVIDDIIETYQKYCRGYLSENKREAASVEITSGSFPTDSTDVDKQIFKNLGLTKNKMVSLVYRPDESNIQTSDLDKLCLDVLSFLLGEKTFNDVDLEPLMRTLKDLQSSKLHQVIRRRWDAIASLQSGDLAAALSIIETTYNTFSEDASIPKWLINDILIDWRNLKNVEDQIRSVYEFSVQEKIDKQNSLIHFPLVDRFSTNIDEDIWDRNFKAVTGSPFSTTYYSLEHLFGYISNYLFASIYYGSYTHVVLTLKEIQKALFDIVQKENNLLHKIQLMRVSILRGDESSFEKIAGKYGSSLSHSTTKEILELYELANTKPLQYQRTRWKLILFREFGYYFSDPDYQTISNEILGFFRTWIHEDSSNVFLGEKFFDAWKSNIARLSQEEIVAFTMEILDKKAYRFFDSVFDILSRIDFSKLSGELTKSLLSKISTVLSNGDKKRNHQHVESLLIRMRKGQNILGTEIDDIVEKFYPEFYKQDYNLEIFPEKRDTHIPRYIANIKARNKTQGAGGRFTGYLDRPYYTVRKIVELEEPSISEELLNELLETILSTLSLETQTHAEKIDAVELLITLKGQKLSYSYDWNAYYAKLDASFSEAEKGHSNLFSKDQALSLRLHLIFVKLNFGVDCLQELLETLALISSSEEYEIISSLIALKDFLNHEANKLDGNPVMPIVVQYISSFCFHESHDIRYRTVEALYALIETPYADFVVNRLSKMMDDDDYRVRWAVLNQLAEIMKINESTYNYVVGKARIDNNYLVRRVVEKFT